MKQRDYISLIEEQLDKKISDPVVVLNTLAKRYQKEASKSHGLFSKTSQYVTLSTKIINILEEKLVKDDKESKLTNKPDTRLMRAFTMLNHELKAEVKPKFANVLGAFLSCYPEHYKNVNDNIKKSVTLDFEWVNRHFNDQLALAEKNIENPDMAGESAFNLAHGVELVEKERRSRLFSHITKNLPSMFPSPSLLTEAIYAAENKDKKMIAERIIKIIEKQEGVGRHNYDEIFVNIIKELNVEDANPILNKLYELTDKEESRFYAMMFFADLIQQKIKFDQELNVVTKAVDRLSMYKDDELYLGAERRVINFSNIKLADDANRDRALLKIEMEIKQHKDNIQNSNITTWAKLLTQCPVPLQQKKADELFREMKSQDKFNIRMANTMLAIWHKHASDSVRQNLNNQLLELLQSKDAANIMGIASGMDRLIFAAINSLPSDQKTHLIQHLFTLLLNTNSYNDWMSMNFVRLNDAPKALQIQTIDHLLKIKNESKDYWGTSYLLLAVMANHNIERRGVIIDFLLHVLNETPNQHYHQGALIGLAIVLASCDLPVSESTLIYQKLLSYFTSDNGEMRDLAVYLCCQAPTLSLSKENRLNVGSFMGLPIDEVIYVQNENINLSKEVFEEKKDSIIQEFLRLSEYKMSKDEKSLKGLEDRRMSNDQKATANLHRFVSVSLGSLASVASQQQRKQMIQKLLTMFDQHDYRFKVNIFHALKQIAEHLSIEDQVSLIREIRASNMREAFPTSLPHFSRLNIARRIAEKHIADTVPELVDGIPQLIGEYALHWNGSRLI